MRLWAILLVSAFWIVLALIIVKGVRAHPRPFPLHGCAVRSAFTSTKAHGGIRGAPHYGGMQFTWSTWLRNGGAKYALYPHQATPHEQLHVARTTYLREGGVGAVVEHGQEMRAPVTEAWKDLERRVCRALGAERKPQISVGRYATGSDDDGTAPFAVECKRTAKYQLRQKWIEQARLNGHMTKRPWLLVVAEHNDRRPLAVLDFWVFAQLVQEAGRMPRLERDDPLGES